MSRKKASLVLTDNAVGAAIVHARRQIEVTQEELAEAVDLGPQVIARIEKGQRPARITEISAIEVALHMHPGDLTRSAADFL